MATINRVVLSGRLARDPEVREIKQGLSLARITICVSDKFKKRDGTEAEEILFLDCTLWGAEALNAAKYLTKGKAITVEGRLKEEKWNDKNTGQERRKIVLVADRVMYMEKMAPVANYVDPMPEKTKQASITEPIHDGNEEYDELPF